MWVDPLNPKTGLIGPDGDQAISISNDDAKTWTSYDGAGLGPSTDFFGAIAVDKSGHVYKAAAGGYRGPSDVTPDGTVTFNYFDRSTNEWGPQAVTIPTPEGDALWPWIIAGDDGRVGVVWYQSLAGKPTEFHIYAAYTTNGHGTTVTCSDGSTKFIPPQFSVANASGRPIHIGNVCLAGTTCNLNTGEGGDRRLGDFLTINVDLDGKLMIASADTTFKNPVDGPKPVGNPIFIRQSGGDPLYETPIAPRQTRPICLLVPTCW